MTDDLYKLVESDYKLNGKASIDDVQSRWELHLKPFFGGLGARQVTSELVSHYT